MKRWRWLLAAAALTVACSTPAVVAEAPAPQPPPVAAQAAPPADAGPPAATPGAPGGAAVAPASDAAAAPGGAPPAEASPPPPPPPEPAAPAPPPLPAPPPTVVVPYRIEVRTTDAATQDFPSAVRSVLEDPRGWQQAGFDLVEDPSATYLLVIAEGPEVDALCLPYRTRSTYSCQNAGVVAFNADRWRTATPQWTGDLATYRQYLVNHEVGHLLGQGHVDCPGPGQPSPIMVQQSTELDGCLATGWPLPGEIAVAARHEEPIAPGPGES